MGWMAPAGIIVQGDGCHACPKEAIRMQIGTIGIDLAERVFQVHGVDQDGNVVLRKQLRRAQVLGFFGKLPRVSSAWRLVGHRTIGRARSQPSAMRCG